MDRNKIAEVLNNTGRLLELKGENFFKVRAYYDAARTIETLEDDPAVLVSENRLGEIKGFGRALTQKITELVTTGRMIYYENLKEEFPNSIMDLFRLKGLGPRKISVLYRELGIKSIEELRQACKNGRLLGIKGFGEKTQKRILESVDTALKYSESHHYSEAIQLARLMAEYFKKRAKTDSYSIAGSLRRKMEVVKDIDIVAGSKDPEGVLQAFIRMDAVERVEGRGDTKASVLMTGGIGADLRVVTPEQYPYALHHFTGSREHNTALRHIARKEGCKVNEYGIFRDDVLIKCKDEKQIYEVFDMDYIPPELRENMGELEVAVKGTLPELVRDKDIKGVIHVHTTSSDGHNTLEDYVVSCMQRGYSYLGVADHSVSAFYARGLKTDDISRQHEEIDRLNEKYKAFRIFKGIEADILADGSVDYGDSILSRFDFVIASVHSSFNMDAKDMTNRIKKALHNRHVNILGHPTGRLLLMREQYRVDLDSIIYSAAEEGVAIEINANPYRLDLDWRYCRKAKEAGCSFVICPDAHSTDGINDVEYGINTARKGWLTAADILNSLSASEFLSFLCSIKNRRQ